MLHSNNSKLSSSVHLNQFKRACYLKHPVIERFSNQTFFNTIFLLYITEKIQQFHSSILGQFMPLNIRSCTKCSQSNILM